MSGLLQRGVWYDSSEEALRPHISNFDQSMVGSTFFAGQGGVVNLADSVPSFDTADESSGLLFTGQGMGHSGFELNVGVGWVGFNGTSRVAFESAPGLINGQHAELFWLGQVVLPAGASFVTDPFLEPYARTMQVLVNAESGISPTEAQTSFTMRNFETTATGA